jgi:hypothetical protein
MISVKLRFVIITYIYIYIYEESKIYLCVFSYMQNKIIIHIMYACIYLIYLLILLERSLAFHIMNKFIKTARFFDYFLV